MDIGTRVRDGQRTGRVEDLADRLEACIERYLAGEIDSAALSTSTKLLWEEASEDAATHAALSDLVTTRALADFPITSAGRLVGRDPGGRDVLSTCWTYGRWETIGPDDGSEDVVHDTGEAAEAHHYTRCAALGLDVVRVDRAGETEALCSRIAEAHVALADGDRETARSILADVLTVLALGGGE